MKTKKIQILIMTTIIMLSISGCNKSAANGTETAMAIETTEPETFTESMSISETEADLSVEISSDIEASSDSEISSDSALSRETEITAPSFLTELADEVILSTEAFTIWGVDGIRSEPYVKNGFSPCELIIDDVTHPALYTEDGLMLMHSTDETGRLHHYTFTYNGKTLEVTGINGPFCERVTIYLQDVDADGIEDVMMSCYKGSDSIADVVVVRAQPLEIIPFSCDREAVNEFITDMAITEVKSYESGDSYVTYTATDAHGNTYTGHELVKAGEYGNAEDYEINCWTIPNPTFYGVSFGEGMDLTGDINCHTRISCNVNTGAEAVRMADMWIKYTYDAETGCYVSSKAFLWAEDENGTQDWIEIVK